MYDGWTITRWETPVVDIDRLGLVALSDSAGELCLVLEEIGASTRARWRVRFTDYPAYRNIDEAYRTELWAWLDQSRQRCGFTFTVEESQRFASWDATGYLRDFNPSLRHFVVATMDDVAEVLTSQSPTWEALGSAALAPPFQPKVVHLTSGEDDAAIAELADAVRRAHADSLLDLRTLQARWQLKLLASEQLPDIATHLLAQGVESPALIELAGLVRPTYWEAAPVLDRVFTQAALPRVPREAALWRLAYAAAQDIVSHAVTPHDGATSLWQIATDLEMPEPLRYFIYLAADYGEGPGDEATEKAWFDARIRETAQELLGARPPGGESPPWNAAQ